jgi:amino acid transporter
MPVTPYNVATYLVFLTGISFFTTWIVRNTRGSVFLAVLVHAGSNGGGLALSYLFPKIANKKAIWEIEVWLLGVAMMVIAILTLINYLKAKKSKILYATD